MLTVLLGGLASACPGCEGRFPVGLNIGRLKARYDQDFRPSEPLPPLPPIAAPAAKASAEKKSKPVVTSGKAPVQKTSTSRKP